MVNAIDLPAMTTRVLGKAEAQRFRLLELKRATHWPSSLLLHEHSAACELGFPDTLVLRPLVVAAIVSQKWVPIRVLLCSAALRNGEPGHAARRARRRSHTPSGPRQRNVLPQSSHRPHPSSSKTTRLERQTPQIPDDGFSIPRCRRSSAICASSN